MAEVCVALGMAPSEYWALQPDEESALIKELNAVRKRQNKG